MWKENWPKIRPMSSGKLLGCSVRALKEEILENWEQEDLGKKMCMNLREQAPRTKIWVSHVNAGQRVSNTKEALDI